MAPGIIAYARCLPSIEAERRKKYVLCFPQGTVP
jgi:hypothetical protein